MMSSASIDPFYEAFGALVRKHRDRQKGMTQSKLGELVGLSRTSITNIEKGRQHVALHQVFALAYALRVTPNALMPTATNDDGGISLEDRLPPGTDPQIAQWVSKIVNAKPQKESALEKS